MFVQIKNDEFAIKFKHEIQGIPVLDKKGLPIPKSGRFTQCTILSSPSKEFISTGYSRVHPTDPFVKEKGRMFSLLRALEDGNFSREQKKIICAAYKNRKPNT
jgi:hypothetical protein